MQGLKVRSLRNGQSFSVRWETMQGCSLHGKPAISVGKSNGSRRHSVWKVQNHVWGDALFLFFLVFLAVDLSYFYTISHSTRMFCWLLKTSDGFRFNYPIAMRGLWDADLSIVEKQTWSLKTSPLLQWHTAMQPADTITLVETSRSTSNTGFTRKRPAALIFFFFFLDEAVYSSPGGACLKKKIIKRNHFRNHDYFSSRKIVARTIKLCLCPGFNTTTIFRSATTLKIAIFRNYHNFVKIHSSRWAFSAKNLANIHLATNLTKIAIFLNSRNFRNLRELRSSCWALQQISVGKYNKYKEYPSFFYSQSTSRVTWDCETETNILIPLCNFQHSNGISKISRKKSLKFAN